MTALLALTTTTNAFATPPVLPEVDFTCPQADSLGVVGLAPLEVHCAVVPPAGGTYTRATWTFGDGSVVEGDAASFVYGEEGQYNVSVVLEDWLADGTTVPIDLERMRYGFVTVCGEPDPSFTYENMGGLDYQLENTSTIAVNCVDVLQWDVFEVGADTPVFQDNGWEPRFELAGEGKHLVRLTMGGIGGTASAELTIDARRQLNDALQDGPLACGTVPGGGGGVAAALGALAAAAVRRRRAATT